MNFQKDDQLMFNTYLHVSRGVALNEQEQQAVNQQKVEQALSDPKAQQAMQAQAESLMKQYAKQIEQAKQQGPQALEALLKQIQGELDKQAKAKAAQASPKTPTKESLELEEGFFGRTASLVSGATKKIGDAMAGRNTNTSFRQEAILKHFEKLKTNLGSHLRELQRDMSTTSGTDEKVKGTVNNIIQKIQDVHKITPTSSKFQDFRHSVGKFAQNVLTGAVLAAPFAFALAPLAAMGIAGAAAASAVSAGSVSMLKDMINGQKPDPKRAAKMAAIAAVTGGLARGISDHISHTNTPDAAATDSSVSDVDASDVGAGDGAGEVGDPISDSGDGAGEVGDPVSDTGGTDTDPSGAESYEDTGRLSNLNTDIDINDAFKQLTNSTYNPASKLDVATMKALDGLLRNTHGQSAEGVIPDSVKNMFDALTRDSSVSTSQRIANLESFTKMLDRVSDSARARIMDSALPDMSYSQMVKAVKNIVALNGKK